MAIVIKETKKAEPKTVRVQDLKKGDVFRERVGRYNYYMVVGDKRKVVNMEATGWLHNWNVITLQLDGNDEGEIILWKGGIVVEQIFDAEITLIERKAGG